MQSYITGVDNAYTTAG